jgi:hypothetical protein
MRVTRIETHIASAYINTVGEGEPAVKPSFKERAHTSSIDVYVNRDRATSLDTEPTATPEVPPHESDAIPTPRTTSTPT